MANNVASHPYRELLEEAKRELEIADSAEGETLREAIFEAVDGYSKFLERHDWPRLKAQALVVTHDYGRCDGIDITLKDGALDRVYGNGVNPDPERLGPTDIPHKWRRVAAFTGFLLYPTKEASVLSVRGATVGNRSPVTSSPYC